MTSSFNKSWVSIRPIFNTSGLFCSLYSLFSTIRIEFVAVELIYFYTSRSRKLRYVKKLNSLYRHTVHSTQCLHSFTINTDVANYQNMFFPTHMQ